MERNGNITLIKVFVEHLIMVNNDADMFVDLVRVYYSCDIEIIYYCFDDGHINLHRSLVNS